MNRTETNDPEKDQRQMLQDISDWLEINPSPEPTELLKMKKDIDKLITRQNEERWKPRKKNDNTTLLFMLLTGLVLVVFIAAFLGLSIHWWNP